MTIFTYKISAALAFTIGALSILMGSKVLIGTYIPDYSVLQWLPVYNVSIGVLSVGVSVIIWKRNPLMRNFSFLIIAFHSIVLILLTTVFNEEVASESMKAMIFRITIWFIIIILNLKISKNEN